MHTITTVAAAVILAVAPSPEPSPAPEPQPSMVVEDHWAEPSCDEPTVLSGQVIYAVFLREVDPGVFVEDWVIEEDSRVEVSLTAAQEVECFPEPEPAPVVVEQPAPELVAEVGTVDFAQRVAEANPGAVVVRVELG